MIWTVLTSVIQDIADYDTLEQNKRQRSHGRRCMAATRMQGGGAGGEHDDYWWVHTHDNQWKGTVSDLSLRPIDEPAPTEQGAQLAMF